jgi:NAD+ kinase
VKVLVLGNAQKAGVTAEVERWLPIVRAQAEVLIVDLLQEQDLACFAEADLALVFGGDGAILRAARQMAYCQVPVLGVNLGRLGFLADIQPAELDGCLAHVLAGQYRVTRHLMFECVIEDTVSGEARTFLGLNEMAVHSIPPLHMVNLELDVDGVAVSHFGGDGLIVSTPVGSTGHNLSAGGPILEQELAAFVITPICPHTLTYRPIVESADKQFAIRLLGGVQRALVVVDGQASAEVTERHRIVIRRAPVSFGLVKVAGRSFYQALRDKLRWGMTPSYRGEP